MHVLDVFFCVGVLVAVVVQAEVVGRRGFDVRVVHEAGQPVGAGGIGGAGRGYKFLFAVTAEGGDNLIFPILNSLLHTNTIALGLVEEMHNGLLTLQHKFPFIPIEFSLEMDHRTERGAALELGRDPGVPVGDGVEGAIKVHFVHLFGDFVGVGVVPEEGAFADYHFGE